MIIAVITINSHSNLDLISSTYKIYFISKPHFSQISFPSSDVRKSSNFWAASGFLANFVTPTGTVLGQFWFCGISITSMF